ncbi:alpha-amylase family glycosyl hydrolase [Mycoplasmopsis cynos]|uniref:alpha-amylase family glycosyl hydrolase n=1 Tax=Mycoplasmopsis cynos TaxID=171284 RepID=UPI002AFEAAEC|nr:alpha-amylase family glycosyl hydrolase [Mycoplasmopsis cynos]WQQ14501.1 alpha-amylase family glycosyl hydrolase [Mycoplasmopsis cynos]
MNANIKNTLKSFNEFDNTFAHKHDDLGVNIIKDQINIKLWQPLAKEVKILLYKTSNLDRSESFKMDKREDLKNHYSVWEISLSKEKYQDYYYQFEIIQEDNTRTIALDPYAKSLAPFNWEGKGYKVAKGVLLKKDPIEIGKKPCDLDVKWNNSVDPIIYEMHVRDFTSLFDEYEIKDKLTFNGLIQANIFEYLKKLNITHLQLLPIHAAYSVNDLDRKILLKNQGSKWSTNYNWGYDPLNYFSINGLYSTNAENPYARIEEFKNFVDLAHKNGIGIILDVVYNHMMDNHILDDVIPGYYYRDEATKKPVIFPPLADERYVVRKLMFDSLKYFVEVFNVDGFRFDLSCFHHKETIDYIVTNLRKIKPNLVFHGEAWKFTDLNLEDSYIKGITNNKLFFGYFNDSIRDAIKGSEHEVNSPGLIHKYNKEQFLEYTSSIVAGLKNYSFGEIPHSVDSYSLFNEDVGINLNYAACHDGFTLWDKVNIFAENKTFIERIEMYRQGIMMSVVAQGRYLMLAGTELLQSKPCDYSGEESERCVISPYDDFGLEPENNSYCPNSYKTTDYTNGIKWNNLKNKDVKKYVFDFVADLNKFRMNTDYLRLDTNEKIIKRLKFLESDVEKGILIFKIDNIDHTKELIVMHNFGTKDYDIKNYNGSVLFESKIDNKNNILQANSTIIMER